MALEFIAGTDLPLTDEIGGEGGVSGVIGRTASACAALPVPTARKTHAPPDLACASGGDAKKTGGVSQTQYPCGLQEADPTLPTIPTCLYGTAVIPCAVTPACSGRAGIECFPPAAMFAF